MQSERLVSENISFDENRYGEGFQPLARSGIRMNSSLNSSQLLENNEIHSDSTIIRMDEIQDRFDFENNFYTDFSQLFEYETKKMQLYGLVLKQREIDGRVMSIDELFELYDNNKGGFWVDILAPSVDDLEMIANRLGIHQLTVDDIMSSQTREKQEEFANYYYVVFQERQVVRNANTFENINMNILIFQNFVISIHLRPVNSIIDVVYDFKHTFENSITSDWIMYKFLDNIVKNVLIYVSAMYKDVVGIDKLIEEMVGSSSQEDLMLRISETRRRHAELRDALINKRDVLIMVTSEKYNPFLTPNVKIYLKEVVDHVVLALQRLELAGELLGYSNNMYMALISLSMTRSANDVNLIMKRFSATALILLPPTVLVGLWGMNVPVPGGTYPIGAAGYVWFLLILAVIILWIIASLLVFKHKGWI